MDLKGPTAVCPAAGGGGMGGATARALARAGAAVALHYRQSAERAEQLADELAQHGARACTVQGDLATRDGPAAVCREAGERLGPIDILINAAGGWVQKPLLEVSVEEFDSLMHSDVRATLLTTQAVAPGMIDRGWGRVVNFSSIASMRYLAGEGAYGTAKAAINLLTKAWAVELAPHGITVNAVAPALTEAADKPLPRPEDHPETGDIPNGRPGHSNEVAALVAYLCADIAAHITGQIIPIDGGWSAKGVRAH